MVETFFLWGMQAVLGDLLGLSKFSKNADVLTYLTHIGTSSRLIKTNKLMNFNIKDWRIDIIILCW